jgi:hypothetical protein
MLRADLLERLAEQDAEDQPGVGEAHPVKYRDAIEEARRQLAAETGRQAR